MSEKMPPLNDPQKKTTPRLETAEGLGTQAKRGLTRRGFAFTSSAAIAAGTGYLGATMAGKRFFPNAERWVLDEERLQKELRELSKTRPKESKPDPEEKRSRWDRLRRKAEEYGQEVIDYAKETPQKLLLRGHITYLQSALGAYDATRAGSFLILAGFTYFVVRHPVSWLIEGKAKYAKEKATEDAINSGADRLDAVEQKLAEQREKLVAQGEQIEGLLAALAAKAETTAGVTEAERRDLVAKIEQFGELAIEGLGIQGDSNTYGPQQEISPDTPDSEKQD